MKTNKIGDRLTSIVAWLCCLSAAIAADPAGSQTQLQISDGSLFQAKDFYPKFSWDVTPQYFMFGNQQRVLLPNEVASIAARTDFVCLEKSHGLDMLGAAELGAKHDAAAFKKVKPSIKVLFYFNSAYAWPFTSYNRAFTLDKIDQHPELKKLLLVDPATGELARRGRTLQFDVLNPELRSWWVNTVAQGVETSGCDGVFIDQMHGFAWLREDKSEQVEKAMGEMMASLKEKMGPDKILLGNNANQAIARHVLPVVDACMFEHYNAKLLSKESLLQDWGHMLKNAKAGKISVFRIGAEVDKGAPRSRRGNRNGGIAAHSQQRLEYYLACYLIGAQPYSYFQYGWGWRLDTGPLVDYPELLKGLGPPQEAYQRTEPDDWVFTREFEHASVWLDTEKKEARITWHEERDN